MKPWIPEVKMWNHRLLHLFTYQWTITITGHSSNNTLQIGSFRCIVEVNVTQSEQWPLTQRIVKINICVWRILIYSKLCLWQCLVLVQWIMTEFVYIFFIGNMPMVTFLQNDIMLLLAHHITAVWKWNLQWHRNVNENNVTLNHTLNLTDSNHANY